MDIVWILPDRAQSGTVLSESNGKIAPLHRAVDLSELPRALVLGIPEELLLRASARPRPFYQFARLEEGVSLFAAAIDAGRDVGRRTVVVTLLLRLKAGETLDANMLRDIRLPTSELKSAASLLSVISVDFVQRGSDLMSLMNAVEKFPTRKTFASQETRRSANPPDWSKKKVDGGGW